MSIRFRAVLAAALCLVAAPVAAGDAARDLSRIADEGFNRSEVMTTAAWLTDRIGGRMTNSPAMREAEAWTQDRFKAWGLTNVHTETFPFGQGWSFESISVRMTAPRILALRAIPVAWSIGTEGPLSAPVVVAPIKQARDLEAYRGKLAGKIVLVSLPEEGSEPAKPAFERMDEGQIAKLDAYEQPKNDPEALKRRIERYRFVMQDLDTLLKAEGAVAMVRQSVRDGNLLHGEGYKFKTGTALPVVELSAEDYRRVARLAKTGQVTLEIDSRVRFHKDNPNGANVIADIAGSDPKAGYVMAGAHLDSWIAGDGATDNAAGSAVVMEAARILSRLNVKPRRAIRFALWSGEEQGLFGSRAYVETHLARRPPNPDPNADPISDFVNWAYRFPVTPLADYDRMAGYFNLDNGSGKIRGIFAEGNFAAVPALREIMGPLSSMGAGAVVAQRTYSTDHQLMSEVGLPAFQFIQDPLDYFTRTHHSSADTFDHLKGEDLRQAAVVLAYVLLQAADRPEPLPRKPIPTEPSVTDPFSYPDPAQH